MPEDTPEESTNEKNLRVDVSFYGTNVMDGLKRMLIHGLIEPPIHYWMKEIVSQGIDEVYVTKDDVLQGGSVDEEEIENEEPWNTLVDPFLYILYYLQCINDTVNITSWNEQFLCGSNRNRVV